MVTSIFLGHQCKTKWLNALTGSVDQEIHLVTEEDIPEDDVEPLPLTEEEIVDEAISLHSLSRVEVPNTIRLKGKLVRKN